MKKSWKTKQDKTSYNYVFGNAYRTEIYSLCMEKNWSVPELQEKLKLTHRTILYHVGILEKAGFIRVVKHEDKQGRPKEIEAVPEREGDPILSLKQRLDIQKRDWVRIIDLISQAKNYFSGMTTLDSEETSKFWADRDKNDNSSHTPRVRIIKRMTNIKYPNKKAYSVSLEFAKQMFVERILQFKKKYPNLKPYLIVIQYEVKKKVTQEEIDEMTSTILNAGAEKVGKIDAVVQITYIENNPELIDILKQSLVYDGEGYESGFYGSVSISAFYK